MVDLEKIERKVLRGYDVADTLEKFDWKEFEETVGDIFRINDFVVKNNFRFKTKRRWENDLLSVRCGLVFCVDCKRWAQGRDKKWDIRKAAKKQQERTSELRKFVKSNPIARSMLKIPSLTFVPLVVTLYQENVLKVGKTFVVPVEKLNSFIVNYDALI